MVRNTEGKRKRGRERERWRKQRERDALLLSALLPQRLGYRSLWCSANFKFHYREPPSFLSLPPPLLPISALALKQAFLPPPIAEVKKLKALQKRLFVWVNYSLGCVYAPNVCLSVCLNMQVCESRAGSGEESGFGGACHIFDCLRSPPPTLSCHSTKHTPTSDRDHWPFWVRRTLTHHNLACADGQSRASTSSMEMPFSS